MLHYDVRETSKGLALAEEQFDRRFLSKTETVFAQCNGYLGVRAAFEGKMAGETRGTFLGGFYHSASPDEVTELVNCPDVTEFDVLMGGEEITLDLCRILDYQRQFFLDTGELEISVLLETAGGKRVRQKSRRFVSRADKYMIVHEMSLTPEEEQELVVTTGINGQITNSGVCHFDKVQSKVFDRKYMYTQHICDDGQELMVLCGVRADRKPKRADFGLKRRSLYVTQQFYLDAGETLSILKCSSFEHIGEKEQGEKRDEKKAALLEERKTALLTAEEQGYDRLLSSHSAASELLLAPARIHIEGASLQEKACIAFAVYHLLGMTPMDTDRYSVGAKGLTGEGYKGHVFWDTELFVLPFFTAVYPETAGNLLSYRRRGLSGARKKAEAYGFLGAMYPWESAVTGEEETPLYAALNIHTGKANKVWSGIKEHHVTADIIYALCNYLMLTRDNEFLQEKGYEMLIETAMFWYSRSRYNVEEGRYEILDIIGPDEYTEHVDNNAYTNYMAGYNVSMACGELNKLRLQNPEDYEKLNRRYDLKIWQARFKDYLDKLYLPGENKDGIIPQDDTFLQKKELPGIETYKNSDVRQAVLLDYGRDEIVNMQVLKQADLVMLLNLMPTLFPPDTVKKNVLFYEERTIHDSSLSYCAHAIACAKIGEVEAAQRFFEKAMEIDLDANPKDSTDGIHSGSLGGLYNCLIQGFAGVEYEEGCIKITPNLPKGWKRMEFTHTAGKTRCRLCVSKEGVTAAWGDGGAYKGLPSENGKTYRLYF